MTACCGVTRFLVIGRMMFVRIPGHMIFIFDAQLFDLFASARTYHAVHTMNNNKIGFPSKQSAK